MSAPAKGPIVVYVPMRVVGYARGVQVPVPDDVARRYLEQRPVPRHMALRHRVRVTK